MSNDHLGDIDEVATGNSLGARGLEVPNSNKLRGADGGSSAPLVEEVLGNSRNEVFRQACLAGTPDRLINGSGIFL